MWHGVLIQVHLQQFSVLVLICYVSFPRSTVAVEMFAGAVIFAIFTSATVSWNYRIKWNINIKIQIIRVSVSTRELLLKHVFAKFVPRKIRNLTVRKGNYIFLFFLRNHVSEVENIIDSTFVLKVHFKSSY